MKLLKGGNCCGVQVLRFEMSLDISDVVRTIIYGFESLPFLF